MLVPPKVEEILSNHELLEQMITDVFQQMDLDHNGYVSENELDIFLEKLNFVLMRPPPTKEEVHEILKTLDKNHDEKLTKDELKNFIIELFKMMANTDANPS